MCYVNYLPIEAFIKESFCWLIDLNEWLFILEASNCMHTITNFLISQKLNHVTISKCKSNTNHYPWWDMTRNSYLFLYFHIYENSLAGVNKSHRQNIFIHQLTFVCISYYWTWVLFVFFVKQKYNEIWHKIV